MKNPLVFLLLLLFALPSYAAVDSSVDEQNRLMQRQEQYERVQTEQKELQKVQKEEQDFEEERDEDLEQESGKIVQDLRSIQCFRITQVNFSESKILSKMEEKSLIGDSVSRCLTVNQIIKLRKKINNYLIDKGYTTSRVLIPKQSLRSGILNIEIIESKLEKLIFNDEKLSDKTQKFMAFNQVEEGEVLNLRGIEQGLEQVNRLPSNHATIKILPGSQDKSSIVAVENKAARRLRLNAGFDNNGVKRTGENRETVGFTQDNLLWLNDSLTMNRTGNSLDPHRQDRGGSNSFSSNFSVPFGWYTLTMSYSHSSYHFWQQTNSRASKFAGHTLTRAINLDRILIKEKSFKISSSLGLTNRYNLSSQDSEQITVQTRKASIASLSLPSTFFFSNSSLYVKPTYSKSLAILDAKKDEPSVLNNNAHAQFDVFRFYTNYSKRFQVAQVPTSYNLTFDSQYSKQTLYGIDQFFAGGAYSVRSFKEGSISGDSGYNIKNEFTVNLGQLILPHFNQEKIPGYAKNLNRFSLTPFYDYGYVRAHDGHEAGRISGAGLKLSFSHQNLTSSLIVARALTKSQLLGSKYSENNAVFFNISSEIGFF